jgi:hypothetical protein
MARRQITWLDGTLLLAIAAALAVALVPAWRWWLVGRLRGEHFYAGRPTSNWRHAIRAAQ